jgi:Protein of unknown function with PCYCGC motif
MVDNRRKRKIARRRLLISLPLFAVVVSACSSQSTPTDQTLVANLALNQWPEQFMRAAPDIQADYRFAVANPDVLRYIPCYCGCVNQGHTSNHDCYVQETRSDGTVVLDPMSFG